VIDIRGGSAEVGPWISHDYCYAFEGEDHCYPSEGYETRCYPFAGNILATNHNTIIVTYVRPLQLDNWHIQGSFKAAWTTSKICQTDVSRNLDYAEFECSHNWSL